MLYCTCGGQNGGHAPGCSYGPPSRAEFDALNADLRIVAAALLRLAPFVDRHIHPDNEPAGTTRRLPWHTVQDLDRIVREQP